MGGDGDLPQHKQKNSDPTYAERVQGWWSAATRTKNSDIGVDGVLPKYEQKICYPTTSDYGDGDLPQHDQKNGGNF